MTNARNVHGTLRILGVADIVSGFIGMVTGSWLADQLDLPTALVVATGAFLVAVGVASLTRADRPAMARATIAVEAVSALTLLGVIVAGTTTTGLVISLALVAWCTAAALTVTTLTRPQPAVVATP